MSLGQRQRHDAISGGRLPGASSCPTVLELRHVTCAYEQGRPAICDISLAIREGEILCLLGPSGCGTTTTLRVIAGFEPITAGEVYLEGRLVSSPGSLMATERRRVGMVFQDYALFPHLRVLDNIAFGLRNLPKEERGARVSTMLALIGLTGLERRYPHELSGGQQQRAGIARGLANQPQYILADEPTGNLDTATTAEILALMARLNPWAVPFTAILFGVFYVGSGALQRQMGLPFPLVWIIQGVVILAFLASRAVRQRQLQAV